ncbi:MAG: hypothetical protein ACOX6T_23935 [Myxococcales bacterium]|jgi:hypothetical protein
MRRTGLLAIALLLLGSCGGNGDEEDATTIEVRNNSALTMDEVRFSTCASAVFGEDVLDGAVGPQQTFTFEVDGGGCYDVFVVLVDSAGATFNATFSSVQVADGEQASITVTNP